MWVYANPIKQFNLWRLGEAGAHGCLKNTRSWFESSSLHHFIGDSYNGLLQLTLNQKMGVQFTHPQPFYCVDVDR